MPECVRSACTHGCSPMPSGKRGNGTPMKERLVSLYCTHIEVIRRRQHFRVIYKVWFRLGLG
jgi:hypothetical protein